MDGLKGPRTPPALQIAHKMVGRVMRKREGERKRGDRKQALLFPFPYPASFYTRITTRRGAGDEQEGVKRREASA